MAEVGNGTVISRAHHQRSRYRLNQFKMRFHRSILFPELQSRGIWPSPRYRANSGRLAQPSQGGKHLRGDLPTTGVILVAVNEQQRGIHIGNVHEGGVFEVDLRYLPRGSSE